MAQKNNIGTLIYGVGLTPEEMARRIHVCKASVTNWMDGKHEPRPANLMLLEMELVREGEHTQPVFMYR